MEQEKRRKTDFELPPLVDLFSNEEMRQDAKLPRIREIPLKEIDDFPDHPFKVRDDEDMTQLVESIKEKGVITPVMLRKKEDGRYEMVSGHRRKRACELAGMETIRSEVVQMDRDEAIILMCDSNLQRSEILPSEKAFAYKMRLEAMKRQAGRPSKENSCPVGADLRGVRSDKILADEVNESARQVQRYIRLTYLVPELLDMVDERSMKMRPAVELSYLDEDCQRDLVFAIDDNMCTPSHDQAIRMRKYFADGLLNTELINKIMEEDKPNQRDRLIIHNKNVLALIPEEVKPPEREAYVVEALKCYNSFLRTRARGGRDAR